MDENFEKSSDFMMSALITFLLIQKGIIFCNENNALESEFQYDLEDSVQERCWEFIRVKELASDELNKLYNNDSRVTNILHDIYDRYGRLWKYVKIPNYDCNTLDNNEATQFILWAADNNYTVEDLVNIGNGTKLIE